MSEIAFERRTMRKFQQLANSFWFDKIESASIRGIPDRIGIINGRFIALEFKKDDKDLFPPKGRAKLQAHELRKIRRAGGYAEFIFPGNFTKIYNDLKRISNGI